MLRWREIKSATDLAWRETRVLYAYLDPHATEILYIGKCDGTTVRQRWQNKPEVWRFIKQEGIEQDAVPVLVGIPILESRRRLSRRLLEDIESLLIHSLKPRGNIAAIKDRTSRPGLRVECRGGWHGWEEEYVDLG